MTKVRIARASIAMVGVLATVLACSSSKTDTRPVGAGCVVASDCSDPLVCAYQRCHAQCATSKDCSSGQRCVGSNFPKLGVCLLDDESTCDRNADCPKPLVCGRRLKCEEQCKDSRDCFGAQVCSKGSCAQPDDVPEVGPDGGDGVPLGKPGDTCVYNSECNAPLVCRGGACVVECKTDVDCALGLSCQANVCRPIGSSGDAGTDAADATSSDATPSDATIAGSEGAPCTYASECSSPLICRSSGRCGFECVSDADCPPPLGCATHSCVLGVRGRDGGAGDATDDGHAGDADAGKSCSDFTSCDDGLFCDGLERCIAGHCADAADTPCNSHSSCTLDTCTESTKSCKHTTMATIDADGDGHLDVACGGDDCDDHDAKTFPGAPEQCNGKDDNCNGLIDDYAVVPRGAAVQDTGISTHLSGVGALFGGGYVRVVGNNSGSAAQTVSTAGVAGTDTNFVTGAPITTLAMAGGTVASLVVYDLASVSVTGAAVRQATIVKSDSTAGATIPLVSLQAQGGDADVIWTGSQFALAWAQLRPGTSGTGFTGYYGFVQADGTFTGGKPVPDGDGGIVGGGTPRIAFNGSNYAVGYTNGSGFASVVILNLGGDKVVGPVNLTPGSGSIFAGVAGAVGGFVALTTDGRAAFVSNAGALGKKATLSGSFSMVHGSSDGKGAAFAARTAEGARFLYARDQMEDGLESGIAYTPSTSSTSDQVSFGQLGGKFGVFYFAGTDQRVHMITAACLP